jgi:O-methyltransferase
MDLLKNYPIISDQVTREELRQILELFEKALKNNVQGDVVELGCYVGTTTLFLRRLLLAYKSDKILHAYDSFEGLPPKTAEDASPAGEQFKAGELHAQRSAFVKHFKQAGLPLPVMHKAWFSELTPDDMPEKIAFAFLDGDFYGSIRDSLKLVWPRLAEGAIVVVDDYQSEALPGAKRAVDEWVRTHPARLQVAYSLAILRP